MKMSQNCSYVKLEPQSIPFSFFDLASGLLFRYPNPLAKHVQCYDVVSPFQINENGELVGKSLVMKTNPIPKLFHALCSDIGVKYKNKTCIPLVEEYTTDLAEKTVQHLSRNIMCRDFLITHERSVYNAAGNETTGCIVDDSVKSTMMVTKDLACRTDATHYR